MCSRTIAAPSESCGPSRRGHRPRRRRSVFAPPWHLTPPPSHPASQSGSMPASSKKVVALAAAAAPLQPAALPQTPRAREGRKACRTESSTALVQGGSSSSDPEGAPDCHQRLGIDWLVSLEGRSSSTPGQRVFMSGRVSWLTLSLETPSPSHAAPPSGGVRPPAHAAAPDTAPAHAHPPRVRGSPPHHGPIRWGRLGARATAAHGRLSRPQQPAVAQAPPAPTPRHPPCRRAAALQDCSATPRAPLGALPGRGG